MIQSKTFSNFVAAPILATALLLSAGCSSLGAIPPASGPYPVTPETPTAPTPPSVPTTPTTPDPPVPPPPQLTMRTLPQGYVPDFTPHAGLVSMTVSSFNGGITENPVPPYGYAYDDVSVVTRSDAVVDVCRNPPDQHSRAV